MSKKNRKGSETPVSHSLTGGASAHAAEYKIIKHDLLKVVYLNVIYLGAVMALYFTNQKSHYLEHWFSKIFHF